MCVCACVCVAIEFVCVRVLEGLRKSACAQTRTCLRSRCRLTHSCTSCTHPCVRMHSYSYTHACVRRPLPLGTTRSSEDVVRRGEVACGCRVLERGVVGGVHWWLGGWVGGWVGDWVVGLDVGTGVCDVKATALFIV